MGRDVGPCSPGALWCRMWRGPILATWVKMREKNESATPMVLVVGAGISGLAAARHLRVANPGSRVLVLDKAERCGGMIETESWRGLTIEHGPEGVVTNKPEAVELIEAVGLGEEIVLSGPAPRRTFIVRNGTLRPLPYGILNPTRSAAKNLLASPLLSKSAKLRLCAEPLVWRRRDCADESVKEFISRRFGAGLLESVVEPLIGGIHGDQASNLSAEMLVPALRRLELDGRSIALAALRQGRATEHRPLPPLVTLRDGMGSLVDRLAAELDGSIRLGEAVTSLRRDREFWVAQTDSGESIVADKVIIALPAAAAAGLLEPHDSIVAGSIRSLPSSGSQTVTLIWERGLTGFAADGTGFLVPRDEQSAVAACTWTTAKWHFRSGDGSVMFRCFMRAPGESDDGLAVLATGELTDLMGSLPEPTRVIVRQVDDALPIMAVGHRTRIDEIHERVGAIGDLAIAGAGLEGSGLPACIRSGVRAAEAVS